MGALSAPPYLADSFLAAKRGDNSHTLHSPILISCKQNILASYPHPYHSYQSIFHLVKFIKEQKKEEDKQVIRERTKISVYNTQKLNIGWVMKNWNVTEVRSNRIYIPSKWITCTQGYLPSFNQQIFIDHLQSYCASFSPRGNTSEQDIITPVLTKLIFHYRKLV